MIDRASGDQPPKMSEETFSKGFNKMSASERRLWLADIESGAFKILPEPGVEEDSGVMREDGRNDDDDREDEGGGEGDQAGEDDQSQERDEPGESDGAGEGDEDVESDGAD